MIVFQYIVVGGCFSIVLYGKPPPYPVTRFDANQHSDCRHALSPDVFLLFLPAAALSRGRAGKTVVEILLMPIRRYGTSAIRLAYQSCGILLYGRCSGIPYADFWVGTFCYNIWKTAPLELHMALRLLALWHMHTTPCWLC